MMLKAPTAVSIMTTPRRRSLRSVTGRQPFEQSLREPGKRRQVLLVRPVRIARIGERRDDDAAAVRQLGMDDLGERVVGVADLALVNRALGESTAHAAVPRVARPAQAFAHVVAGGGAEGVREDRKSTR